MYCGKGFLKFRNMFVMKSTNISGVTIYIIRKMIVKLLKGFTSGFESTGREKDPGTKGEGGLHEQNPSA